MSATWKDRLVVALIVGPLAFFAGTWHGTWSFERELERLVPEHVRAYLHTSEGEEVMAEVICENPHQWYVEGTACRD